MVSDGTVHKSQVKHTLKNIARAYNTKRTIKCSDNIDTDTAIHLLDQFKEIARNATPDQIPGLALDHFPLKRNKIFFVFNDDMGGMLYSDDDLVILIGADTATIYWHQQSLLLERKFLRR